MGLSKTLRNLFGRAKARLTGRYYFEDYVRVYPDGIVYDRSGRRRAASENDRKNLLNHAKFYRFAAQFVRGKRVADLGCGSGHGCRILAKAGAASVRGVDASAEAVAFAREHYGRFAEFSAGTVTDLREFADDSVDVAVSSEVLEHVKEYGVEAQAVAEMRRITTDGGLLVIETPNSEMLAGHGFSFDEIARLFGTSDRPAKGLSAALVFENALVPFGERRQAWERRLAEGKVGTMVSSEINLTETVLPTGVNEAELKRGIEPGPCPFAGREVDTSLLHNTHGWVIVAINKR